MFPITLALPWLAILAQPPQVVGPAPVGQTAGQRAGQILRIDGSVTPEQIPDVAAYRVLFGLLTGPGSGQFRERFISISGLGDADARLVFREADRYAESLDEAHRIAVEIHQRNPRFSTPAQREALHRANLETTRLLEESVRSLSFDLSPEGRARFNGYVLNHIKRKTAVTGAGIIQQNISVAAVPAPSVPPESAYLNAMALAGAASEKERNALIEAANSALMVRHVSENETGTLIEVWNATTKDISNFQVALCAPSPGGTGQGVSAVPGFQFSIAPGAKFDLQVSRRNRPLCDPITPKTSTVIFGDGTAVGLPMEIERFKMELLGQIVETERIAGILDAAGDTPNLVELIGWIGETPPSLSPEAMASFASVLTGADRAAADSASEFARRIMYGAMWRVRSVLLNRIKALAPGRLSAPNISWKRLRDDVKTWSLACRTYREKAGRNLYP